MEDKLNRDEFSVVEFYVNGTHRYVERWLPAKEAVELAKRCTDAAELAGSLVTRVIITDGGDFTVFQWEQGRGVTFPERKA